tara:strand:+ start:953 stop:1156 length:204 start_codon:yes stop_codon:yes gene_type:complete
MSGLKMNMRLFTNQSSMMQPKVQNNLINQLIVNNSRGQNVKLGCNVRRNYAAFQFQGEKKCGSCGKR